MTHDVALRTVTELSIDPEQLAFTEAQRSALAQLGIEDAPEGDQMLFFHQAKRTGLDPFAKQIYMLGRRTKVKEWDEKQRKQVEKWVMKYTIQTGIDGYRVTGHRLAAQRGDEIEVEDTLWCGESGSWSDVWLDRKNPPLAAKYTVIKNGKRYSAVAMYDEYVQTVTFDGVTKPNSMWAKMPANQIAKCAEGAAWRKAYPNDFSGIVLEDTAQAITIDADPEPSGTRPALRGGNAGLRAALNARKQQPAEPDPVEAEAEVDPEPAPPVPADPADLERLRGRLEAIGLRTLDDTVAWLCDVVQRPEIKVPKDLRASEIPVVEAAIEKAEQPE